MDGWKCWKSPRVSNTFELFTEKLLCLDWRCTANTGCQWASFIHSKLTNLDQSVQEGRSEKKTKQDWAGEAFLYLCVWCLFSSGNLTISRKWLTDIVYVEAARSRVQSFDHALTWLSFHSVERDHFFCNVLGNTVLFVPSCSPEHIC